MIRLILMSAVALALAVLPASAQTGTGKGSDSRPRNPLQEKADSEAYKSALQRIPDASDKYDPWAIARPSPPEGKSGKVK